MYIYSMAQLFIEGTTTDLETTLYTVGQPNTLGMLNNLRFNCPLASVVTITIIKDSTDYNLYTLTLDEGDTVSDTYPYNLNAGDSFMLKANTIGITYTFNVTQV